MINRAVSVPVVVMVVAGTIVDLSGVQLKRRGVQSIGHLILMCFSARKNARKLMFVPYVPKALSGHTEDDEDDTEQDRMQRMTALHGLKVFLMILLVVVNTYLFVGVRNLSNFSNTFAAFDYTISSPLFVATVLNGWQYIADAFLVLSGLLVTSQLLPKLEESKGTLHYFAIAFHRFVRLWPGLLFATCLYVLWPLLASGPLAASESRKQLDSCDAGFWPHLLFISNWLPLNTVS